MTGRVSSGLLLSLQGQNLLYIQAFDDNQRQKLTSVLERENWKSSTLEFGIILNRVQNILSLQEAFLLKNEEEFTNNGVNNNKEDIKTMIEKFPGAIIVSVFFSKN